MDKIIEEDLKGLEDEIDDAVDRLFIEKKRGGAENLIMDSQFLEPPLEPPVLESAAKPQTFEAPLESLILEPSIRTQAEPPGKPSLSEPSYEFEKMFELETSPPPPPPAAPVPFLKSIEKMEAQLLSLEWEITEDKLKKTKEEILALRELMKQRTDITAILTCMDKVLAHMIKNGENIPPPWIKFLLDSKETIKLLMKKETEGEINIYKKLASDGIEARFSCLEGMKETKPVPPTFSKGERVEKAEIAVSGEKKIEDMSNKISVFMEKAEEIFRTMKQQISKLEEKAQRPPELSPEVKPLPVSITIFKVDEKLLGVESEKVFKLFKVPNTFQEKYSNQEKIRLKDLEVKMVDLRKILSIQGEGPKREIRILAVKDNGGYKGFLIDQVLKKLSTTSGRGGEVGEYFSGVIHSTYQEEPVEIPILNLKKF